MLQKHCPASMFHFLVLLVFAALSLMPARSCGAEEAQPGQNAAAQPLKIGRITPSGNDVAPGRQIVFEFNAPVVPLGRMERSPSEIPIQIEPALSCQWRWLNSSNLACQLDDQHALAPSTRYNITVRPEFKSMEGAVLAASVKHSFITQRPKATSANFMKWLSPVKPIFRVRFNQPVQLSSLQAHVYFNAEKGPRIPAIVQEDSRQSKIEPGHVWLFTPAADLPPDTNASLFVEPGTISTRGPEPGIEKRALASFHTLPSFRFEGIQCKSLSGKELILRPDAPSPPPSACNPANSVALLFTSPVAEAELRQKMAITPVGKSGETTGIWPEGEGYSRLSEMHKKGEFYSYYLENESLKPFTQYRIQVKANSLKDEFGRTAAKPVDMRFATDHMPPDLHIFKNMSVLEKGLETDLPILATNLEQIQITYEALTADGKLPAVSEVLPGPKAQDVATPIPLTIRKRISAASGVLTGNLSTKPPVRDKEYQPSWFFAQVTPFHVHVKLGHYNALVWITDLQTGEPVPDVAIRIQKDTFKELGDNAEILTEGVTDSNGVAELAGTEKIDPKLQFSEGFKAKPPWLFVWCRKNADIAVVPLQFDFRVDSEGSNHQYIPSWMKSRHEHLRAWGATAQGIYKAGDTVQYKIYVRDEKNRSFTQPPSATYQLKVVDPSSRVVHQRDGIRLSEFGAFDGEFLIPKNGSVGYYRFQLTSDFAKLDLNPLRVLVSDFTPSPFRVTTELNGKLFGPGETVTVSTQAKLHAGGPYSRADTRITATVEPRAFKTDDPAVRDFEFDVVDKEEQERQRVQIIFQGSGKLDNDGNLETRFAVPELPVYYGRLTAESSVRDERGKSVANRSEAACYARDRFIGLLQSDWVLEEGKPTKISFIVVDQLGNPAPGTPVRISVEKLETKAARVKEAGDTYPTQYTHEWITVETHDAQSGTEPGIFEFIPKQSGTVRIVGEVSDTKGRVQKTVLRRWISGKSRVLWELTEGNLLNIYPEKEEYRVGDTARIFVQNPYPGAKALITVERYGTIDRWVKTLGQSSEILDIPVLPDYLPGFYVSVLVMSPRVDKPLGPGGEDLGKPVFRMGYARLEVKDEFKEIQVQCKSDKDVYKPRETVRLDFEAKPKNPVQGQPAPPVELAVAVLDEAVFDLLGQKRLAFDPYQGFYKLDDLDLVNYNLIMQLVGREKLEKKGASPAAAAGFDLSMRSVFKFVSYWNPSLRVNEEGKASVQFQLPDNLTGWRVLVMAVTPDDRMGLGEATFKVNQSTEIRPVMPNQVREGDSFSAGFSIMNRTAETRNIEVRIQAEGPISTDPGSTPASSQVLAAEPFKRYTVRLPLKAAGSGAIAFTVQAGDDRDKDATQHVLQVSPIVSREVSAAYGTIQGGLASQQILFPDNARPGSTLLDLNIAPSVVGSLDGAFDYMKNYPHECWEQKISRAVLAGMLPNLAPYLPKTFSWQNSTAAADKILATAAEFQAPNGGMAFYLPRDEYVSPFLSAFTALAFNWLRESGRVPPVPVEEKLQRYLQEMLKREDAQNAASYGIMANVRALALSALAGGGKATKADLERRFKDLPRMSLFGKAMFLDALAKVPDTLTMQREVLQNILSHADQASGTIRFTEPPDSALQNILSSTLRDNAAILLAFLSYRSANPSDTVLGDIPVRLTRTVTLARKGRDHWASTQENLFAAMAVMRFSRAFETEKPQMSIQAFLDQASLGEGRFESHTDPPLSMEYKAQDSDGGRKAATVIKTEGQGKAYYQATLSYTPAEFGKEPINAGIEIHREYSVERDGKWVLLQSPAEISTGELVRVDLFVSLPSERFFVVVEDPVPGGLEPVNRELATASAVDVQKGESPFPADSLSNRYSDWKSFGASRWSFYHKELRHSAARFYSERLNARRYHLSYAAQAIAPGQFMALPARAEEMYNPDVFGKSAPSVLKVNPAE